VRAAPVVTSDLGRGKPVGAVVAAAKVPRALHVAERPLNASKGARSAGLYRGTAYNILKTLEAEGFVGYDEPTRTYSMSPARPRARAWGLATQQAHVEDKQTRRSCATAAVTRPSASAARRR
jgi:DNA-binding IclR family transcriptional regulator